MCLLKTDNDADKCNPLRHKANMLCPNEWITKWDEQREAGSFPGITAADLAPGKGKKGH